MRSVVQVFSFDLMSKLILGALGIILIRYMPPSQYATYTFALSLAAFVTHGVSATFNRIYILSAQDEPRPGSEWSALALQALIISALIILGLPLLSSLGASYWLIAALILATCASEFAKTYYQRDLKFFRFSLIELARSLAFFLCAIILISVSERSVSSDEIIGAQLLSLLIVTVFALTQGAKNWNTTSLRGVMHYARSLINPDYAYLFAYLFIVGLFTQADIFMLKIIGDEMMIASYGSAFRYYSILSLALGAVHAVLLPMIQRSTNIDGIRNVLSMQRKMLVIFAAGTAFAAWLAHWMIPWVDGGKYPEAIATFRILCVSAVISFAFSPHANLLMRYKQFRFLSLTILLALAVHVALCILLIPARGAIGAATATTISAALANLAFFRRAQACIGSEPQS